MVAVWFLQISIWLVRAIWTVVLAKTLIELGFLAFHFTLQGPNGARKWITETYGGYRFEGDFIYQPSPEKVYGEFTSSLQWQSVWLGLGLLLPRFLTKTKRKWIDELNYDHWAKALSISPDRAQKNHAEPGVPTKST